MRRRDFVKGILAASAAAKTAMGQQSPASAAAPVAPGTPPPTATAPGPVPWMRGLLDVKPLPMTPLVADAVAANDASFFNQQQTATLRRFAEVLMPPLKGYPGALEAGTPEFLDFLIGASPRDRQQLYTEGLEKLDAEAKRLFGIPFAQAGNWQADQVIRPWLRTWITDNPPKEPFTRFINVAHSDIRTATINSQAWSAVAVAAGKHPPDTGLFWYPVDPDLHRQAAEVGRQLNKRPS